MSVETDHDVDSVVDKVLEVIKGVAGRIPEAAQALPSFEYASGNKPSSRFNNRGKLPYRSRSRNFRGGYQPSTSQVRRCRACHSTDHYVREGPGDSVRLVEIKATILGTNHAPNIYD